MRRTLSLLAVPVISFAGALLAGGTAQAAEVEAALPPCVNSVVTAASAVPQPGSLATVTGGNVTVHGGVVVSYVGSVEGPVIALVTICDF